jgi:hypothetical protein
MAKRKPKAVSEREVLDTALALTTAIAKPARKKPGNPNLGKEGEPYRWKPGQSGNPAGRPRSSIEMKQKAAAYTDLALEVKAMTLMVARIRLQKALDILTDPNNVPTVEDIELCSQAIDTAALGAAVAILDRGHGRPQQKVEHDLTSVFDQMTDDEVERYVLEKAGALVTGMVARKKAADDG